MKRILLLIFTFVLAFGCVSEKRIKQKYGIARDPYWFPLQLNEFFVSMEGFTNALIPEIAKDQKVPLFLFDVDWGSLFRGLEEEEYGGVLSSLDINLITETKYSFSDPIILLGPVLIVRSDSNATSLNDLKESIVGINEFDESVLIVQEYPSVIIKTYDNMPTALADLAEGKIDGVLLDTLHAHAWIFQLYPNQLKIVTSPLNNKAIRLITLKDRNKKLITHFNKGLQSLRKSSRYTALRKEFSLL